MSRPRFAAAALAASLALGGCATVAEYDYERLRTSTDPLEPLNRTIFSFNEALDDVVLRPVALGYQAVVPELVRWMVSNAFSNLADVGTSANQLLQGKPLKAASDLGRFAINSIFGFGGIADVASELGLEKNREDFGQTLGVWGVGTGPYLVLPLLGPSTLRDGLALVVDYQTDPVSWISSDGRRNHARLLRVVDTRESLLRAGRLISGAALDKYLFVRDGFLQRRRNMVWDGDPPRFDDDE